MKASIHICSLALAGALAACAQHGGVNDTSYVPQNGGPGYGVGTETNAVPGARPPPGGAAQGSSGTGVTGSGNAGAYGVGESGSAPESTGAANPHARGGNTSSQGGSAAGTTGSGANQHAMCALQQRLKAARTEEERQAILDQAMPGMTPDLRQQQLQAMREECP